MDHTDEKYFDSSRGMHYHYYLSLPATQDSSKPVLILFHGFPDGAALCQFMIPILQKAVDLSILAPDLLGYGGSSKPTTLQDHTPVLVAQDVLEILAHEGLEDRALIPIGHDWGSFYAQRFYLLHPDRCGGLVNLSVAYMPPSDQPFDLAKVNATTTSAFGYPIYAYWEFFNAPDGPAVLDTRLESFWIVMHGQEDEWMKKLYCVPGTMREFVEKDRRDVPLKAYARTGGGLREDWMRMMKEGGFLSAVSPYRMLTGNYAIETEKDMPKRIEKPYLFIGSTGDAVCRYDMLQQPIQDGLIADVTERQLEAGHWIPYEKPEEICDAIVHWLKEKAIV